MATTEYVNDLKIKGPSAKLDFFHFCSTAWKRLLRTSRKQYDANIDYELYLERSREDFRKKWNDVMPSPHTGLLGFIEIGTLGAGSFGSVQLVQKEASSEFYAAKVLSKHKVVMSRQVKNAFCEKRVLHSIDFPFHTSLKFSRKDNDYLYLGMTLVRGGELFTFHRKVQRFTETQAIFYAAQVVLALEYLHALNLVYRDLKPENICIDVNGYIKVTDYGFTKYVSTRTLTLCGTPEYLAPEVIKMKPYSTSVDWWAFGIFVYELVAGCSPFEVFAKDPLTMYENICEGKYKFPTSFSSSLRHLVNHLLQTNTSKRLGVCGEGSRNIKRHVWFYKVDWHGLLNQSVQPPYVPRNLELNEFVKAKQRVQKISEFDQYEELFREF